MSLHSNLDEIEYGDVFQIADAYNIPASVTIEVGTSCNMRCKHCYIPTHGNDELQFEVINDIFLQLRKLGTFEIVLTGGELFLRRDAIDIVQRARELGFDVIVFSNATLISENIARTLGESYIGMFSTSIYSMDESVHDSITGIKGSLSKTLSGLAFLKKYHVSVEVKTMIMKENCGGLNEIHRYCMENGFGCVASPYLFCRTDYSKEPIRLRLDSNELVEIMPVVDKIIDFSPQSRTAEDYMCPSLRHSFGIGASGKVYPCNAMFYEIGDIQKNTLEQIWNSEKLNEVKNLRIKDLPMCNNCNDMNYCVRCAGIALTETGNMKNKFDFACKIAHIRKNKCQI